MDIIINYDNINMFKLQLLVKIYVSSTKCIILWVKLVCLKQYLLCTQQNKLFIDMDIYLSIYLYIIYLYLDIYF